MNLRQAIALFTLLIAASFALMPALAPLAHAADLKDPGFQILPECDATKFPKDRDDATASSSCGFMKFQELIVNVSKWLVYTMVVIAICLIGWAGLKIMTSAGNSEAIHQAYGMIKIVVIGILIAATSYIIVVNVFRLLNVNATYNILT